MLCSLLCSVVDFIASFHRKPFTYTHILGRTVLSDKCLSGGNHSKAIITNFFIFFLGGKQLFLLIL